MSAPSTTRKRVLRRDRFTCTACGFSDPSGRLLEVDHIVPEILGGSDSADNLRTLCKGCHFKVTRNLIDDRMERIRQLKRKPREAHPGLIGE